MNCKWYLQVDDFESLKSITCILLDQSLDSNPLMLNLTISEHFKNKHKNYTSSDKNFNNNRMNEFSRTDNYLALSSETSVDNKNFKRFQSYGGISRKPKLNPNLNSTKLETRLGLSISLMLEI